MSTLLHHGVIQGALRNADLELRTDRGAYDVGDTVRFSGTLIFTENEHVLVHRVALVVDGPGGEDLNLALPLEGGEVQDLTGDRTMAGRLTAEVSLTGVVSPGGTLPSGSKLVGGMLPDSMDCSEASPSRSLRPESRSPTLPALGLFTSGQEFKGVGETGRITYTVNWLSEIGGDYQAQLVFTAVGREGCRVTRSPIVRFSLLAAVNTPTPTATPTPVPTDTPTPAPTATATAGHASADRHARPGAHGNTAAHRYADSGTYTHRDGYGHAHAHAAAYRHTGPGAHTNDCASTDSDTYADSDPESHTHRLAGADAHAGARVADRAHPDRGGPRGPDAAPL